MARDLIESELTGAQTRRLHFALADAGDDEGIRRLLRENPLMGQISLSFEREPDFFTDAHRPGEDKQTIVARENGRVVCVGSCTIRQRSVNGRSAKVGYLGGLRLTTEHAGRYDILRQGYAFFHQLQLASPAEYYFTSIAADNRRARALLERGLPGMPQYEFIGEFVTVLLAAQRRRETEPDLSECQPTSESLVALLNQPSPARQLAPVWSEAELAGLRPLGLDKKDFRFITHNGNIQAAAALWDQSSFKQTVVRGYAPGLARWRPLLNVAARITGGVRLPDVGERLRNAFVSHLFSDPQKPELFMRLITQIRRMAAARKIETITLGFAANDPQLVTLRRNFRAHEYRSRIYIVRWPDVGGTARSLEDGVLAPEVALL